MSIDTFTFKSTASNTGSGEFALRTTQFGDGYKQDAPVGINSEKQKWQVTVPGVTTYLNDVVLQFIRDHKGKGFYWKPPLGPKGLYKCSKWNVSLQSNNYGVLVLDFEQTYAP